MQSTLQTLLLTSLLTATSAIAGQHACPLGNAAYVVNSRGQVVHNRYGECVRTSAWTRELALPACDPTLFPATEEAAAPVPTPAPAPAPQPVVKTRTLGAGALFALNQASLSEQGRMNLDALVSELRQMDRIDSIQVVGHTDSSGSDAYNQGLSMRRAESVKGYLVGKGIAADLITTRGLGETQPVADNATPAGRASNRRVEISIQGSETLLP